MFPVTTADNGAIEEVRSIFDWATIIDIPGMDPINIQVDKFWILLSLVDLFLDTFKEKPKNNLIHFEYISPEYIIGSYICCMRYSIPWQRARNTVYLVTLMYPLSHMVIYKSLYHVWTVICVRLPNQWFSDPTYFC